MARRTRAGTFARVRGWLRRWSYTYSTSVALVLSVQDDIRVTVKLRAEQA